MRNKNIFILLAILAFSIHVFGQDSLIKIEPVFFPVYYHAKNSIKTIEKDRVETYQLSPGILITYPLSNKLSITSGLLFSNKSVKSEYNDSTFANNDPTIPVLQNTYYRSIIKDETFIILPIYFNYKLFTNKNIDLLGSFGLNYPLYSLLYEERNFYSSNSLINYNKYLLIFENLELTLNTTFVINVIKHIGIFVKPFISYDIIERKNSLNGGVGIGIYIK